MLRKNLMMACGLLFALIAQSQSSVDMLEGKWKIEGKDVFEVWQKSNAEYKGYSYKVKGGQESRMESLHISKLKNQWVYVATVPNQNEGKGVPFTLNSQEKKMLSFENPEHDFPVKIQYKFESEKRVFVSVLGGDGKGFSYFMRKQ